MMKCKIGGREVELNIEGRMPVSPSSGLHRPDAARQVRGGVDSDTQRKRCSTSGQSRKVIGTPAAGANPAPSPLYVVIPGNPIGKPRQTRSDKWKQRPCVMRYRSWADEARKAAFGHPDKKLTLTGPTTLRVVAYLEAPKKQHRVGPHTVKPDIDNIEKAVMDALFANDHMVYRSNVEKVWADGGLPRVIVEWSEKIGFPVNQ